MQEMKKVVRLGAIPGIGGVYCKIAITLQKEGFVLSISGVEGPMANGYCHGACGQINTQARDKESGGGWENIIYAPRWSKELVDTFLNVWDRWHLNDMCAGSPRQAEFLREHAEEWDRKVFTSHYDWAKHVLEAAGLHPDEEYLHDGKPYEYGSTWLYEALPEDVYDFLNRLPEADRTPAWV